MLRERPILLPSLGSPPLSVSVDCWGGAFLRRLVA